MSEESDYLLALRLSYELNGEDGIQHKSRLDSQPAKSAASQDDDYILALKLQAEEQGESSEPTDDLDGSIQFVYPSKQTNALVESSPKRLASAVNHEEDYLNQTSNLVHSDWEILDPTPNIFSMFVRFDEKFFKKRLGGVVLEWSKRMFSCAGICYLRSNRYTKEITIRLSEPLLKLRPRKDLVETLLHEMIHAYCYMMNIREGNGGHGPNFKRFMNTINQVAGTNISVYHTFHDEVEMYKTHVWRCSGICQNRHPFRGWVKRTSNRAPGPNDQWWEKHTIECGGTFHKVSEPEKSKPVKSKAEKPMRKPTAKKDPSLSGDIRNYIVNPPAKRQAIESNVSNLVGSVPPTSYPGQSHNPFSMPASSKLPTKSNIWGMADLNNSGDEKKNNTAIFKENFLTGEGNTLSGETAAPPTAGGSSTSDSAFVRNIWQKRFNNESTMKNPKEKESETETENTTGKRPHSYVDDSPMLSWESYDEDVMVAEDITPTVLILSSDDEADGNEHAKVSNSTLFASGISSQERTRKIKEEVMSDESRNFDDDEIVLIDDEYDDEQQTDNLDSSLVAATELADQSVIDDLFGVDTLLAEFQLQNDVVPTGSRVKNNLNNDIVACPICFGRIKRSQLSNHFEGCFITNTVEPPSFKPKQPKPRGKPSTGTKRVSSKQLLRNAGYTDAEIAPLNLSTSSDSAHNVTSDEELTPRQMRQRSLFKKTVSCPKCGQELLGHQMEAHRSLCAEKRRR
ncbi:DNA-dependent metalloprotease SPRTN [Drosophila obscura]|uniref:DNA-dependent metalloprotease SPRTN n=1 Tax=Drosophila obscura TaxID=7282 RepID=UPI001BB1B57A|nr:DNA-dependent metalloprotease SPRTN [Drosophila obscura]XP_022216642.2 DNA-dependent metalloprotease SPRTN [Drosophila obscura]